MLPLLNLQLYRLIIDALGNCTAAPTGSRSGSTLMIRDAHGYPYISENNDLDCIGHSYMGRAWSCHNVQILSGNADTVAAINSQTSRVKNCAHLLQGCLAFLTPHYQCKLYGTYLPEKHNTLADAVLHKI